MARNTLTALIEKSQKNPLDAPRDYIGASSIGSDCLRQIWYQFKGVSAEDVPARFRRIWAVGSHLESLILNWISGAGVELYLSDDSLYADDMPYFKGHVDSVWLKKGVPFAIIEVKTAKDASYKLFVKNGVKLWNPQYYAQIQAYMGMSGVHKTYIIAMNKDTCDLSDELVVFDADFYEKLCDKARMIHGAHVEPPRIHSSPLWYQCKMCKYNKVCHG